MIARALRACALRGSRRVHFGSFWDVSFFSGSSFFRSQLVSLCNSWYIIVSYVLRLLYNITVALFITLNEQS